MARASGPGSMMANATGRWTCTYTLATTKCGAAFMVFLMDSCENQPLLPVVER